MTSHLASQVESGQTSNTSGNAATGDSSSSLDLLGVIGFNGSIPRGLLLHPGDSHIIFPLGSTIVIKHLLSNEQFFLQKDGHDRTVSALALSKTGKYLASGQYNHMGFTAPVIIWNLETYTIHKKLILHKGKIQALSFSHDSKYLATLGGRDDNKLIVWDVESGSAICGAPSANETTNCCEFFKSNHLRIITGGHSNLRLWDFDPLHRKLKPNDCQLGQLKRVINSITIDDQDEYMYCGTGTGDCLQISLSHNLFKASGPQAKKSLFSQGILSTCRTNKGNIIVGSGDGTIAVLKATSDFTILRKLKLSSQDGGITSIVLNAAGDHFFVGTSQCNIYLVNLQTFQYELRATCHSQRINQIVFPFNYSSLFATCSACDIRIWNSNNKNELLRIQIPNIVANCVCFTHDGRAILSGWSDGKIRAFRPQSGKIIFCINDAHVGGVSAITSTADSARIISGGENGQVRIWQFHDTQHSMIASIKEHKSRVSCIRVSQDQSECVSSSSDGSCIIWSLSRFVRNQCLFASTQFRSIVYHPDQSQLLTSGTDRKLTYWDVTDGSPIRILDGSATDSINTLDISKDGELFVSGGGDKLVHVWGYDEGYVQKKGYGHSGEITNVSISPNQQFIVSAGDEGAIFLWKMPKPRDNKQTQSEQSEDVRNPATNNNQHQEENIQNLKWQEQKEQTHTRHKNDIHIQRTH